MGVNFGRSKSSKSSTSNVTTTQNAGFSEIAGPAVALQGSNNAITMLDGGAIEKAFSFAEVVNQQASALNSGVIGQSIQAVAESRKTESENISGSAIKYLSWTAMAFAVAWAIKGWAK